MGLENQGGDQLAGTGTEHVDLDTASQQVLLHAITSLCPQGNVREVPAEVSLPELNTAYIVHSGDNLILSPEIRNKTLLFNMVLEGRQARKRNKTHLDWEVK